MTSNGLTEDELDSLVSVAIRRAEILEELEPTRASDAWAEVLLYEEELAKLTRADEVSGGVARVGAVTAALAAGRRDHAAILAARFCAEGALPPERRARIERALQEDQERLAASYPALAKSGRLTELYEWRARAALTRRVFPRAA